MKYTKKNYNKNKKYGGDLKKHNAFAYILSIGYEVETDFLVKLTYKEDINEETGEQEHILLNTDTNTGHIALLESKDEDKNEGEEGEKDEEEADDQILYRQEELTKVDAYNNNNQIDENISFLITNDMGETRLSKRFSQFCCPEQECDEISEEEKNNLYKYRTEKCEDYKIHFFYNKEKDKCETISHVEWVITYYKPTQSNNVIIETFSNAIKNIIRHLSDLEEINGKIIMNSQDGKEIVIDKTLNRKLYHKPNTNLYYLQANSVENPNFFDNLCPTYQMTFATKIEHVFFVMKQLIVDNIKSIECSVEMSKYRLDILEKIEYCVEQLFTRYNEEEPNYKIIKTEQNKILIKQIKNYIGLILFKLFIYYNIYLPNKKLNKDSKKDLYFKDSMFLNPRHSNHNIYLQLKKLLGELFSKSLMNMDEATKQKLLASIIQKIILQPTILNELLLENPTNVRKNAFEITNRPEKPAAIFDENNKRTGYSGNTSYGDPYYSLWSYLQFFEEPINDDTNQYQDGEIITYEWLRYKSIENISTQMDINNDIVLVEVRNFQRIMSTYFYGFADAELKKSMLSNEFCNKIDKACTLGITFGQFKQFFSMNPDMIKGGKKCNRKTRKNRKSTKNRK